MDRLANGEKLKEEDLKDVDKLIEDFKKGADFRS